MRKLVVYVSMGYVGCKKAVEIEVEDDDTDEAIDEIARDALWSMIDWGWCPAEEYKGRVDR